MYRLCSFVQFIALCVAFPDVIDQLKQENANQLVALIDKAGLTSTLKDQTQGPFTILAPTDAAFAKVPQADLNALLSDIDSLKNTLLYHVINGELFTWDILSGMKVRSLSGRSIRIVTSGGKHYFNEALSVKEEIQASNGVIYLIDEVMSVPEGTILQILQNPDYNLTSFLGLVNTVHYNTALNSTSIVQYHLHDGLVHSASLNVDGSITTEYRGHYIHLKHDAVTGEPLLNEIAQVIIADIEAENGVVHVISHVLIPSSLNTIIG